MIQIEFKKYLAEQNTIGYHNDGPGAPYITSDFTGSEMPMNYGGHPLHLPSLDMGLPTVTKTAKIIQIERNKNPISVMLNNQTRLYFSYDEFRRIKGGEPQEGKMMTVVFQRHPGDTTENPSQVQTVTVH